MEETDSYNEFTKEKETEKVDTAQFKCPSCGNNMEFSPKDQMLVCSYCGTKMPIDKVDKVSENPFSKDKFVGEINDDVQVYRCENCGALSEKSTSDISFECPYCKKTNVVLENDIKGVKPTGVVPFRVDKNQIVTYSQKWIKSKFYAPSKIKKQDFNSVLSGIYSPCWTFDCDTYSVYKGRVGKYYTKVVGTGKDRKTVTEIRWRNVSGDLSKRFDDIVINAGKKMEQSEFNQVSSFDTNNAVKYEKKFLAGYSAFHYSVGADVAFTQAEDIMRNRIKDEIVASYDADVVDYMDIKTANSNTTYKYLLLPFYIGSYSYNQKPYGFVANGVSGKIFGKYPKSPLKIALTVLLGLAVVAAIAYFLFFAQV